MLCGVAASQKRAEKGPVNNEQVLAVLKEAESKSAEDYQEPLGA